ncbi:MAG: transposase [Simkania sp.]|nr:transposase [Simkania sp.]
MQKVKIIRLKNLSSKTKNLILKGEKESARLWNFCKETHKKARESREKWPKKEDLRQGAKNLELNMHSQSIQATIAQFLANVDTACQIKKENKKIRLPYKEKRFYPLMWPKQAVSIQKGRILLPMGRGRPSLILPMNTDNIEPGACTLVWKNGYELHLVYEQEDVPKVESDIKATVDLGQIHLAAVMASNGQSLVVSGREIRAQKRQINKAITKTSKRLQRCNPKSRKWRKIQRAKRKLIDRSKRRIRDLRHKATTKVVDFCKENNVSKVFVGNPDGVRSKNTGRKHNQRLAGWEYGKDWEYLKYKTKQAGIESFNGSERGTSSHCPDCGLRKKVKGRWWKCTKCTFECHRDIVGALNMFPLAFDTKVAAPKDITYLRILQRRSSSSLGTGQSCLNVCMESSQPLVGVAQATGHRHTAV